MANLVQVLLASVCQKATNEISDAVDKWLDSVEGSESQDSPEPKGISAAAAKLSEALSLSDDDDSSLEFQKTDMSKEDIKPTASTSTTDALSRLLEAASNAP